MKGEREKGKDGGRENNLFKNLSNNAIQEKKSASFWHYNENKSHLFQSQITNVSIRAVSVQS